MYRESDEICNELDEAPEEVKNIKFRERWECLSKEASEQVHNIICKNFYIMKMINVYKNISSFVVIRYIESKIDY